MKILPALKVFCSMLDCVSLDFIAGKSFSCAKSSNDEEHACTGKMLK